MHCFTRAAASISRQEGSTLFCVFDMIQPENSLREENSQSLAAALSFCLFFFFLFFSPSLCQCHNIHCSNNSGLNSHGASQKSFVRLEVRTRWKFRGTSLIFLMKKSSRVILELGLRNWYKKLLQCCNLVTVQQICGGCWKLSTFQQLCKKKPSGVGDKRAGFSSLNFDYFRCMLWLYVPMENAPGTSHFVYLGWNEPLGAEVT